MTSTLNPEAEPFVPSGSTGATNSMFNMISARAFGNAMAQTNSNQTNSILQSVTSGNQKQQSFDRWTKFGTSMLGGAFGSSLDFAGNLVNAGLQYDLGLKQNATANRALDIQSEQYNKQWAAANSLGLYSISQLGDGSSDFYSSTGAGPSLSRAKRGKNWSPYA